MSVQDSIKKLLNALAEDTDLQERIKKDPEATIRALDGLGLQGEELENLIKGTKIIYEDKNHGTGFNALLAVKSCIPGLAELLAEKNGVKLLMNYLGSGMNAGSACAPVRTLGILTQLLSSKGGTQTLKKLIPMAGLGSLPDLLSMSSLLSKSTEEKEKKPAVREAAGFADTLSNILKGF